jgi:hypothetical protein
MRRIILLVSGSLGFYLMSPSTVRNWASMPASDTAAAAENPTSMEKFISNWDRLHTVKIAKWSGRKGGFGSTMIATFTLQNTNSFDVKDIEITCEQFGNSGTLIDRNVRTVYEIIKANGTKTVRDFNMGFVHAQATKSSCSITAFLP